MIDPKIVRFDELTTGQDPIRRNAILGMIAEYKKKFGFTAILISHNIPDVDCFEFSVYAGPAKGHPNVELESISKMAEFAQKPIGRCQCGLNTKGPANLN